MHREATLRSTGQSEETSGFFRFSFFSNITRGSRAPILTSLSLLFRQALRFQSESSSRTDQKSFRCVRKQAGCAENKKRRERGAVVVGSAQQQQKLFFKSRSPPSRRKRARSSPRTAGGTSDSQTAVSAPSSGVLDPRWELMSVLTEPGQRAKALRSLAAVFRVPLFGEGEGEGARVADLGEFLQE